MFKARKNDDVRKMIPIEVNEKREKTPNKVPILIPKKSQANDTPKKYGKQ